MDPMTQIRVDIEVLRATVRTFTEAAQRVLADSRDVETAVEGASGYDGQLRARVSAIAGQAGPDIRAFADHVAELAAELESIADGFEAADAAQVAGLAGLAVSFRTMIDSGYGAADLPLWLVRGERPPWMSPEQWAGLGMTGMQDAYWAYLQNAWAKFVSGDLTFNHGTQQDMMSAFRIHLFLEGATTALPPYVDWQSAARAAGMSMQDYVMRVLNITAYERDTVAGVGLIETRQVGPLATLLVGQAYYNRLFDEHWGDLDTAKSTFAGGSLDGVYYGHDWEGYTQAALSKLDPPMFSYTAEQLKIRFAGGEAAVELNGIASVARAAEAAQDGAWRLIAGYRLAKEHGIEGVTFFLADEESTWWTYHQDLIHEGFVDYAGLTDYPERYRAEYERYVQEQGLSGAALIAKVNERMEYAVFPEFPDPSTIEGSIELIERANETGNVYEANPRYYKFAESRITADRYGLFTEEIDADLSRYRSELMERERARLLDTEDTAPAVDVESLVDERRENLKVIMPRYLYEGYLDASREEGRPYWESLIILENRYTNTGFVTFNTPDATAFFPGH